jgi:hypothetical protein
MLFIIEVGSNKLKKKTISKTGKKWSSSMGFDPYHKTLWYENSGRTSEMDRIFWHEQVQDELI